MKSRKIKAFLKALSFMFLPTVGVILFMMLACWSVTKPFIFLTSDNGWAILIRVLITALEIGLIVYLYYDELYKSTINDPQRDDCEKVEIPAGRLARDFFPGGTYQDKFYRHETPFSNLVVIERVIKQI